jgi:dCMP deaminase
VEKRYAPRPDEYDLVPQTKETIVYDLEQDLKLLAMAYGSALSHSRDPRTKNGAVLVTRAGNILKEGNRFPRGVDENLDRWGKDYKKHYVEHAERNVLFLAARTGHCTQDATMYVPWFACSDCARAIIECGVKRVVGHAAPFHVKRADWAHSINHADIMLQEAGVNFVRLEYKFEIDILFDGQIERA